LYTGLAVVEEEEEDIERDYVKDVFSFHSRPNWRTLSSSDASGPSILLGTFEYLPFADLGKFFEAYNLFFFFCL